MKYYTKKGDKGSTILIDGKSYPKHHIKVEALGTIDELMSYTGLIRDYINDKQINDDLLKIQRWLASCIEYLLGDEKIVKKELLTASTIKFLEEEIDRMDIDLPRIKDFVIPGGHPTISFCHIARTVCRRAERRTSELIENEKIDIIVLKFLNRLSDYLFVLSRKVSSDLNINEILKNDYL